MAAKLPNFLRLVRNSANLGHVESKMGINGREAAKILKISNKLCKSSAFSIEMGGGGILQYPPGYAPGR